MRVKAADIIQRNMQLRFMLREVDQELADYGVRRALRKLNLLELKNVKGLDQLLNAYRMTLEGIKKRKNLFEDDCDLRDELTNQKGGVLNEDRM